MWWLCGGTCISLTSITTTGCHVFILHFGIKWKIEIPPEFKNLRTFEKVPVLNKHFFSLLPTALSLESYIPCKLQWYINKKIFGDSVLCEYMTLTFVRYEQLFEEPLPVEEDGDKPQGKKAGRWDSSTHTPPLNPLSTPWTTHPT